MQHLFICLLVVKWNYRDAVVYLIGKGVDRVVDNDHVLHSPVCNDPEILHVVAFWRLDTVLAVQSVLEELILRVDIV